MYNTKINNVYNRNKVLFIADIISCVNLRLFSSSLSSFKKENNQKNNNNLDRNMELNPKFSLNDMKFNDEERIVLPLGSVRLSNRELNMRDFFYVIRHIV